MRSGYADAPVVTARITAGPTAVSWSAFWIARRWHDADSVSTAFRCPCINYAARMTSPSTAIAAAPRHLVPRSGENTHQKSRALPNRMVPRRRHTLDSGALGGRLHARPTIPVSLGPSWLAHVPVELHSRRIRCTPNLGCCHLKGWCLETHFFLVPFFAIQSGGSSSGETSGPEETRALFRQWTRYRPTVRVTSPKTRGRSESGALP